jgi:two-component system, NtrC family, sensor histidine kinase HydH
LTLRRTLLLAFVLLGLLPSAALSWLSFTRTRDAMVGQIRLNLEVQARSIQADIDQMLFERFENAAVWSRSELMQDLRLADVDKRVTNYLVDLQQGYPGVYAYLDCRSDDGRIIASSVPSRIGRMVGASDPASMSIRRRLGNGTVTLSLTSSLTLDDSAPFVIETAIDSPYASVSSFTARLDTAFDARQISRLLDAAAIGRRVIVVVDDQGRWVAGSRELRGRALPDAAGRLAGLALTTAPAEGVTRGAPWLGDAALSGKSRSIATPAFAGSGWTTLVYEPVDEALAPVTQMATIFAGLLVAVFLATLLATAWIVPALTARTRRYQQGLVGSEDSPLRSRIAEIDMLARSYDDMVRAVERSREELVRTSKMAMLGELAAVLAHEVRTPLGILRSSAQILRREAGLSPEGRELMAFIESETERLNGLVSTMLDTARPRPPALGRHDIHDLLRRCVQMHDLRRGKAGISHPTLLRLGAVRHMALADAEQLMQLVFNLLNNASQAAGPEGRVELSTFDDLDDLCIACSDDGPGITPEFAERMFDPFISGREGGIGLGLAVVRQVVAAHRGQIQVGRSQWGGARFLVRLPASSLAPTVEEAS